MDEITIRAAVPDDVPRLLEIYSYYVTETAVSFECETPSLAEFERRFREVTSFYPYLAAESGGKVVGYACAHPFVGRRAYDWSAELTIYLDKACVNRGAGRKLYEALEERLRAMGITNLYACIGVPEKDDEYLTHNSISFHEHMGFRTVGVFRGCGRKFGRWYDMVWAEKVIAPRLPDQPPVRSYDETQKGACNAGR